MRKPANNRTDECDAVAREIPGRAGDNCADDRDQRAGTLGSKPVKAKTPATTSAETNTVGK